MKKKLLFLLVAVVLLISPVLGCIAFATPTLNDFSNSFNYTSMLFNFEGDELEFISYMDENLSAYTKSEVFSESNEILNDFTAASGAAYSPNVLFGLTSMPINYDLCVGIYEGDTLVETAVLSSGGALYKFSFRNTAEELTYQSTWAQGQPNYEEPYHYNFSLLATLSGSFYLDALNLVYGYQTLNYDQNTVIRVLGIDNLSLRGRNTVEAGEELTQVINDIIQDKFEWILSAQISDKRTTVISSISPLIQRPNAGIAFYNAIVVEDDILATTPTRWDNFVEKTGLFFAGVGTFFNKTIPDAFTALNNTATAVLGFDFEGAMYGIAAVLGVIVLIMILRLIGSAIKARAKARRESKPPKLNKLVFNPQFPQRRTINLFNKKRKEPRQDFENSTRKEKIKVPVKTKITLTKMKKIFTNINT